MLISENTIRKVIEIAVNRKLPLRDILDEHLDTIIECLRESNRLSKDVVNTLMKIVIVINMTYTDLLVSLEKLSNEKVNQLKEVLVKLYTLSLDLLSKDVKYIRERLNELIRELDEIWISN